MSGSITPLPIMLEEEDRKAYEKLEAPKSMVVRFGYPKLIGEFPYDGESKPGCGSKMVVRSPRGIELAEMLTSTCPNAGCSKSVSRKEMLQYIENSGGKDYPFTNQGKILRVATIEDLNEQARLDARKPEIIRKTKALIIEMDMSMRLVEVELLLGGERMIFYYTAEQWVDFRELVKRLAAEYQTRIEMQQVNDREEARLVADYEKCGQHCCCKQFLKVLKPVSMRSAKVQKATLDPMKISGRCGRLMCCLRYEDETYDDLRKRLPNRKSIVETDDGVGLVLDSQILTQLVLVQVGREKPAAYPVENIRILDKEEAAAWRAEQRAQEQAAESHRQSRSNGASSERGDGGGRGGRGRSSNAGQSPQRRPKPGAPLKDHEVESREGSQAAALPERTDEAGPDAHGQPAQAQGQQEQQGQPGQESDEGKAGGRGKRRRRRRRKRGGGGGGKSAGNASGD